MSRGVQVARVIFSSVALFLLWALLTSGFKAQESLMGDIHQFPGHDDGAEAFAEGAITLWGNLLTLLGSHLRENGVSRIELLELLDMLHETNEETIRSPRARASAARHLHAVRRVLSEL